MSLRTQVRRAFREGLASCVRDSCTTGAVEKDVIIPADLMSVPMLPDLAKTLSGSVTGQETDLESCLDPPPSSSTIDTSSLRATENLARNETSNLQQKLCSQDQNIPREDMNCRDFLDSHNTNRDGSQGPDHGTGASAGSAGKGTGTGTGSSPKSSKNTSSSAAAQHFVLSQQHQHQSAASAAFQKTFTKIPPLEISGRTKSAGSLQTALDPATLSPFSSPLPPNYQPLPGGHSCGGTNLNRFKKLHKKILHPHHGTMRYDVIDGLRKLKISTSSLDLRSAESNLAHPEDARHAKNNRERAYEKARSTSVVSYLFPDNHEDQDEEMQEFDTRTERPAGTKAMKGVRGRLRNTSGDIGLSGHKKSRSFGNLSAILDVYKNTKPIGKENNNARPLTSQTISTYADDISNWSDTLEIPLGPIPTKLVIEDGKRAKNLFKKKKMKGGDQTMEFNHRGWWNSGAI